MNNPTYIKLIRKYLLVIGLIFISTSISFAQDNDTEEQSVSLSTGKQKRIAKKARKAFRKKEYILAKSYYNELTESNTENSDYWYEAGLTYFKSAIDVDLSLEKYNKALELSIETVNPDLYLALGDIYHYNSNYEKAIVYYNQYRSALTNEKNINELDVIVNRKIEIANNGINVSLQKDEKDIILTNLGELINSPAGDYSPVLSNDGNLLLFCSRRPPAKKKTADGQYFEDIFYTTKVDGKWKEAVVIDKNSGYVSQELNRGRRHEAPISLSPDGNSLFIYTENSVWKSEKDSKDQWSSPRRMNQNVNIGDHTPSVFITPNGQELFLVSNGAKGGLGGRDIFYSSILEDGTWNTQRI